MARLLAAVAALLGALVWIAPAGASANVVYGVQDDAWLRYGPGTLDSRVDTLQGLGVDVVRYTIEWREVERRRGSYDWQSADAVLGALHRHGIAPVVTLWGSPGWANGGRTANWAPTRGSTFATFARAAARHFPYVTRWLVWNEPNKRTFLRPTSASVYVQRLLNPAYTAIHAANRRAKVAGGVTGPIAGYGGISPVDFIKAMAGSHARLDVYAHNPYPARPKTETPLAGGCERCATITMATLDKLVRWVGKEWPGKRIWLTEFGYQTNPPDRLLGVSGSQQALYVSEAAERAYLAPRVDMLIQYIVRDDGEIAGWQSGLYDELGRAKPSATAFRIPFAQVSRARTRVVLWGQVRPGRGAQRYVLQRRVGARWVPVGSSRLTSARGYLRRTVAAKPGARFRVWAPRLHLASLELVIR
jgi:hypothetical protein